MYCTTSERTAPSSSASSVRKQSAGCEARGRVSVGSVVILQTFKVSMVVAQTSTPSMAEPGSKVSCVCSQLCLRSLAILASPDNAVRNDHKWSLRPNWLNDTRLTPLDPLHAPSSPPPKKLNPAHHLILQIPFMLIEPRNS